MEERKCVECINSDISFDTLWCNVYKDVVGNIDSCICFSDERFIMGHFDTILNKDVLNGNILTDNDLEEDYNE